MSQQWPGQKVGTAPAAQPAPMPAQGGTITARPVFSVPNTDQQADNARADSQLALEAERVRLAQQKAEQDRVEFEQKQAKQNAGIPRDITDVRAELQNVITKARRAKELSRTGWFATGFGSETAGGIAGTSAADVQALLDTIGGNIAFDRLSRMRAESPTGGALGNVTERELALLQSTVSSLSRAQSDAQFQAAMDDVVTAYERVLNKLPGSEQAPVTDAGTTAMEGGGQDTQALSALDAALRGGASEQEIMALAQRLGVTVNADDLRANIASRDAGGPVNSFVGDQEYPNKVSAAADRLEAQLGEAGLFDLAKRGITLALSDEGAGVGAAIGQMLGGDFNVADNYAFATDVERELLRRARERTGGYGTAAELIGGGGAVRTVGNAALNAGRALAASGQPVTRAGIQSRMVRDAARDGAMVGGVAGFGYGEGTKESLAGGAVGAGGGALLGSLGQRLLNRGAPPARGGGGGPGGTVAPRVPASNTGAPVADAAGETLTQPISEAAATDFGNLARQAVGRGKAARDARDKLAVAAKINPEAKAAADRLGIELPADVLSDDARLITATGLARSQIGSEAQATWGQAVSNAIQRSDETLARIGATRDLAQVSDDVRARLTADIDALETQAVGLRQQVDDAIDVQGRVEARNLQSVLSDTINDMGGLAEAKQAFTAEEKKLLAMLGEGENARMPTYARLNQIRDQIGRALNKGQGPWVDAPTAMLKKYYGALAKDQIAHIESVGGPELANKMRGSNDLFSQMFKSREVMQTVFGKNLERDIGGLINRAVSGASKGDGQNLRTLLGAVPKDMQSRVVLSGIMSQAERAGANGGFSFNRYAQLYRGLRQNEPLYQEIAKTVGKDAANVLRDLYAISNRISAAEAKIVRTGASNQPILNALKAETLVERTIEASKRVGARAAGAMAGSTVGGPAGAFAGQEMGGALVNALTQGGKSNLVKLHDLLASEAFRDLAVKASTGNGDIRAATRLANDPRFVRFGKGLGLNNPQERRQWIISAINAAPPGAANIASGAGGQISSRIGASPLPLAAEGQDTRADRTTTAPGTQ